MIRLILASLLIAGVAHGSEASDLALRAATANDQDCQQLHSADPTDRDALATSIRTVWRELDDALRNVPEPFLLYWRGVLSQCLGDRDEAKNDFEGFVNSAAFLDAIEDDRAQRIDSMMQDAKKRLRRLERPEPRPKKEPRARAASLASENSVPGNSAEANPAPALLVPGIALGVVGFAAHGLSWNEGSIELDEDRYIRLQTANRATFALGVAGSITTGIGLAVLAGTLGPKSVDVAVIPGPITTLAVRF
jgi:hypothetical protein